jgi:hypothetical protein
MTTRIGLSVASFFCPLITSLFNAWFKHIIMPLVSQTNLIS